MPDIPSIIRTSIGGCGLCTGTCSDACGGRAFEKAHHLLDYGCGGGSLIAFLKECGYANAVGYDEFQEGFKDKARSTESTISSCLKT